MPGAHRRRRSRGVRATDAHSKRSHSSGPDRWGRSRERGNREREDVRVRCADAAARARSDRSRARGCAQENDGKGARRGNFGQLGATARFERERSKRDVRGGLRCERRAEPSDAELGGRAGKIRRGPANGGGTRFKGVL